ncbi:MAG: hypothetical protein ACRDWY_02540 [Actinomycetes bacterium]
MTRTLPAMATVSELVRSAVQVASHQVSERSRRNAREALDLRLACHREGVEAIAALVVRPAPASALQRPSA